MIRFHRNTALVGIALNVFSGILNAALGHGGWVIASVVGGVVCTYVYLTVKEQEHG